MSALTGTGTLLRLALRRDRVLMPVWIGTFAGMVTFSAAATIDLYPTEASRVQAAEGLNAAPALVAFYGRVYSPSIGSLSLIKMSGIGAVLLAILAFMLVVRHTRAEEEAGRLELVGAAAVGRSAALTAGLAVGVGTSLAIGVSAAVGLIAVGLPPEGSFAFGLAWATTGCAFAAVGAFSAQLTASGRAASGIAALVLGGAYLLRAAGDAGGGDEVLWLSWLSPIGWSQQVRPFAQERWPVLLLLTGFAVVVTVVAYALSARRDLGAGLLADRPGAAVAPRSLSGVYGLAWRLQRGTAIAWACAVALLGAIVGSITSSIGDIIDDPRAQEFITDLGGTRVLTDAYLALELGMIGSIVCVYAMQATMRLRTEETSWRADAVLGTATARIRWLGSHTLLGIAGGGVLVMLGGLASGIGYALAIGDGSAVPDVLLGAAVQVPAICVMVGLVVAVFGWVPRWTTGTWGALVAFLLIGEFGPLFDLPGWVMDLSPFAHVPRIPGGDLDVASLAGLVVAAAALGAAGAVGTHRRDVRIG